MATEITLAAALRDSVSDDEHYRSVAIRNLASAYLEAIERTGPLWRADTFDTRGPQVVARLWRTFHDDPAMALRGLAAVGLATLGQAEIKDAVGLWLAEDGEGDAAVYRRECAVIALALVGASAPEGEVAFRRDIANTLDEALRSPRPDVRFQAGVALAEVCGLASERSLLQALAVEPHARVRANLIHALAMLDPLGASVCAALVAELDRSADLEAALVLAGAGRAEGGPRLVAALSDPQVRDDALEALAVLGPNAPPEATPAVRALARGWRVAGVTKVRAAYALARMAPAEGRARLEQLARHPKRSVRDAVRDAWAALETLARDSTKEPGHRAR